MTTPAKPGPASGIRRLLALDTSSGRATRSGRPPEIDEIDVVVVTLADEGLIGTWLAHPVPGRVLHSQDVAFDADHMIERCRLFLIIALGETVLTTGRALAKALLR